MQSAKLHSTSCWYCIIQQSMVRFLLVLLTYANLSLSDSKRGSKNDSNLYRIFKKVTGEQSGQIKKIQQLQNWAATSSARVLSQTQKSIKYQTCCLRYTGIKPTAGLLLRLIGNRAKDHTIAQELLTAYPQVTGIRQALITCLHVTSQTKIKAMLLAPLLASRA